MASESWQSAWVEVVPDFKEFKNKANKEMTSVLSAAGDKGGRASKSGIGAGIVGGITGALALGAAGAAADIGRAIGETIGSGINFALDGIDLASSLSETESAIAQVFGDASKDILSFADTANTALGATRQEVLTGAQTFGIFGKAAKLQGPDLANFSTGLVTLATDLGSFNNTSTAEAIAAIGAGLRGEAEPLRNYGILLDDATLRQEALRQGLIQTTKQALTPQQKILAAQGVIYAQTSLQQGDFARTSGGLANQQKILAASFQDAQTKLGTALLPAMTQFATIANDKFVPILNEIVDKVGPVLADALVKSAPAFGDLVTALAPLIPDLVRIGVELLPLMIDSLVLLAPFLIDGAKNTAAFAAVMQGFFEVLSGDTTINELVAKVQGIGGSWQAVSAVVGGAIGKFLADTRRMGNEVGQNVARVVGFFNGIPGNIASAFSRVGSTLYGAGRSLVQGLINGASSLLRNLGNTFANLLPEAIRGPFKAALGINSPSKEFAEYGRNITEGLVIGIKPGLSEVRAITGSMVDVPNVSGNLSYVSSAYSGSGTTAARGGFNNYGTIVTQNVQEFTREMERRQRIAMVLEGIDGMVA